MLRNTFTRVILVALLLSTSFVRDAHAQDPPPTADPNIQPTPMAEVTVEALPTPELVEPTPTEVYVAAPVDTPTVDPLVTPAPIEEATVPPQPVFVPTAPIIPTYTPIPFPESDDPLVRVVSVGESLDSLAAQVGVAPGDLAQLNRITNQNMLLTGQKIQLPVPMPTSIRIHRVRPTDTLAGVAAEYGVSLAALRTANDLVCAACLVAGQLLRVPHAIIDGGSSVETNLTSPFQSVQVFPFLPRQGDTIIVRVKADDATQAISGDLAGHPLHFAKIEDTYVGLSGVAALQDPGIYSITVKLTSKTGDESRIFGRIQIGAGNFGFENLFLAPKLQPLLEPLVNQEERAWLDKAFSKFTPQQRWTEALVLPVNGKFASYYGTRRNFNRGTLRTYHSGVDIVASPGMPVHAAAAGKIVAAEPLQVRGNIIIIDHGRGVFTVYCHLSKFEKEVGDSVQAGDVVGYTGNTGRSLGPHLHWELAIGGVTVNPLAWTNETLP